MSQPQRHTPGPQLTKSLFFFLALVASCSLLERSRQQAAQAAVRPALLVQPLLAAPLPPVAANLSADAPLIFHHQRKTGGTSLRITLLRAAERAGLPAFTPCYCRPCDTYAWGGATAAVYAGHFPWSARHDLSRRAAWDPAAHAWSSPEDSASCLTLFREPVARLESAYYYRFIEERRLHDTDPRLRCLNDVPPDELRDLLLHGRSKWGSSLLSEPFRIFGGPADEGELAAMAAVPPAGGTNPAAIASLQQTLKHLARCVPLVLEEPATLALGAHFFPQLAPAFHFASLPRTGQGPEHCALGLAARTVLEELTAAERVVYDAARARAAAMLQAIGGGGAAAATMAAAQPLAEQAACELMGEAMPAVADSTQPGESERAAGMARAAAQRLGAAGARAALGAAKRVLSLRGPVLKAGPPAHPVMGGPAALAAPCLEQQARYEAALGAGQAPPPEGPCYVCTVHVNHRYRVLYLRVLKAGSTTAVQAFGRCHIENTPGCLVQGLDMVAASLGDLQALWKEYFVFTVLRDPFERAVSSHSHTAKFILESEANTTGSDSACPAPSWDQFCEDPRSSGDLCARRPGCCPPRRHAETMAHFVGKHAGLQAPCIRAAPGGESSPARKLAVDFVARQEHLEEDLRTVFALVNARRDPALPKLNLPASLQRKNASPWRGPCSASRASDGTDRSSSGGGSGSSDNGTVVVGGDSGSSSSGGGGDGACGLEAKYAGEHAHCLQAVASHYSDDLRLLMGM